MIEFPTEIVEMYKELKPAHKRVYRIIRDSIFLGKIKSNEKFTEEAISTALGCSRTPVRSALLKLQSEGLLRHMTKTNIGYQEYSNKDKNDLLELDIFLEGKAVELVAAKGLKEEEFNMLNEVNQMLFDHQTLEESVISEYDVRDLHMQFHLLIAKYSGNKFLYKEIVSLRTMMRSFTSLKARDNDHRNNFKSVIAPLHQELLTAIKEGDSEKASIIMRYEISKAKDVYLSV
ncbi:DNA-binding transcriptional regulator, GntR family [Acetitomaculum ruminis DSM 5522]|uniref:DNA-binding transcriptional regulator, GntR family n=1 Tax=Acetitomaculum ruminis DSM 5522 TaxID=1120918 RepID=A0A1I1APS6_9FIRM|nr:GntR family transcriptional regulator [Acetitomaculum ruminis]SFB40024.1 DNA-binding transcriptional regulator, GntR family [Acetitomaculum ruminis DSM 5522]